MQNNWALMLVMPVLIALGVRHRKDKFVVFGLAIIGAGSIILLMSSESRSQSPTEAVYYYHNDHLGTPLKMTAQNQSVAWDGIYKPFGEIYSTPTADITNNFRFPGQYDDGTQLYYNHNRYYIPELGRYNRVDPVEGGNPYVYAADNPITYFDKNGLLIFKNCNIYKQIAITVAVDIAISKGGDKCTCGNNVDKTKLNDALKFAEYKCEDQECTIGAGGYGCSGNLRDLSKILLPYAAFRGYVASGPAKGKQCGCLESSIFHEGLELIGKEHEDATAIEKACFSCSGYNK